MMDITQALSQTNWLSVIAAAMACFVIGGIWYGPLFGRAWMQGFNLSEDDLRNRSVSMTFGLALLLALVTALNLDMFLGPQSDVITGLMAGLLSGVGFVATLLGILYVFEMQTLKIYLINAGYCVVTLTVMGIILGAW
ncbi:DUF1761 domain-containing protein [Marinicella sp. W31]|uniref:DUF1761 domain-containing protein n=1 Tax=Marinicella sp. W31 TaxID=3023713 RepID=UPI00375699DA